MSNLTFQVIDLVIQRSVFDVYIVIHVVIHEYIVILSLLQIFLDEPLKAFYILFDGVSDLLMQTF